MKIGLIDVDGHNFPNLPLMKLSAWHKAHGDSVEWYSPLWSGHMDRVYMSKVFSFTPDYEHFIDADEIIRGGSGYCIAIKDGKEVFDKSKDIQLPYEIEHIYPDYSIYPEMCKDTAYGFMTRGCPRHCQFCIVGDKEGTRSITVAPLSEFWRGQKNIVLLDPNPLAARDWKNNLQQLIESKALVDFSQGIDIRCMTEEKAAYLKQIRVKTVHFAWDRYADKDIVIPKLKMFKEITGWHRSKMVVYILTNFDTTLEQDLERVYTVRDLGFSPDVRIYEKYRLPKTHDLIRLQCWANNPIIFNSGTANTFEEYNTKKKAKETECENELYALLRQSSSYLR